MVSQEMVGINGFKEVISKIRYPLNKFLRKIGKNETLANKHSGEEPVHEYRLDGYHPTQIGDAFNDRYTIERKLGWGAYSTVWLARDQRSQRHVALKILSGIATMHKRNYELQFLQHIRRADPSHPGYNYVVHLLDHFYHKGPNGRHLCLVTDVMGENLWKVAQRSDSFGCLPSFLAKHLSRQLLLGMDYIHSCNIIHTDLKRDNFLMVLDDPENAIKLETERSPLEVFPLVNRENEDPVIYTKTQPIRAPWELWEVDPRSIKVRIADLGVGCWFDKTEEYPGGIIQSPALRAPEVRLGAGWDKSSDIWMLALSIYELVMGKSLFRIDIEDPSAFALLILCFGEIPRDLVLRGKYASENFNVDGTYQYDIKPNSAPLDRKLAQRFPRLSQSEIKLFTSFLLHMLRMLPEERPDPVEILQHEWLRI